MLYTPATTDVDRLVPLINGQNPDLKRLVVCTEDSVREEDVPLALENLERMTAQYDPQAGVEVFIRARNPGVLDRMLSMPSINSITGFVVPKADPDEFPVYGQLLNKHDHGFVVMPILESAKMTDPRYRTALLDVLVDSEHRDSIDCLRIGGNDLMGQQGIRRDDLDLTIYDTVIGGLINDIVNEFRGNGGFDVTAPVFECFDPKYDELLKKEVRRNVVNQMLGQTVIHPRHIPILNELYKVRTDHFESAQQICGDDALAVKGTNGKMDEKTTHHRWASSILLRAELFGIVETPALSIAS